MNCYRKLFMLLSLAVVTRVAYIFFKRRKDEKAKAVNEVIMSSNGVDKIEKTNYSYYIITKGMNRLLYYLNKPRYNLDIGIFVLTRLNMDSTKALLKLHYRGVRIRIIIDADILFIRGSGRRGLKRLAKQGVRVQLLTCRNLLRRTFCLADTLSDNNNVTPFLMVCHLDWTYKAFNGYCADSISVTSEKELVQQYKDQFERLWDLHTVFKPIVE